MCDFTDPFCWDNISITEPQKIADFMKSEIGVEYDLDCYDESPKRYALTVWEVTLEERDKITLFIRELINK